MSVYPAIDTFFRCPHHLSTQRVCKNGLPAGAVRISDGNYEYRYGVKSDIKKVQEPGEPEYLAPTAEYIGEVVRNENDVITEVIFRKKQQGG